MNSGVFVSAWASVGNTLESVPEDAASAVMWQIRYPGQLFQSIPLEFHLSVGMSKFQVDLIAGALVRTYEAGRQAAFAELRRLIGA